MPPDPLASQHDMDGQQYGQRKPHGPMSDGADTAPAIIGEVVQQVACDDEPEQQRYGKSS